MTPSDTNLELFSGSEREKRLKKRLKPAAEYAEERAERVGDQVEKVKEDMERNKDISEILLYLHEEERKLKEDLGGDLEGIANMQQYDAKQWGELKQLFGKGQYTLTVHAGKDGKPEIAAEMTLAEGNVKERVPLKIPLQESLANQALGKEGGAATCPRCGRGTLVTTNIEDRKVQRCERCGYMVRG